MKIRTRILVQTLSASLALTLALGTVFFLSVASIRKTVLDHANELGDSAAEVSASALEVQLTEKIDRIAQDIALILDERLGKIESHTRMIADITGSIYTAGQAWAPKALPRIRAGTIPPPQPYLYIPPEIPFADIRAEVERAGNINEILRQITVVDQGIAASVIGGESGYAIAMDTYLCPLTDFDPRVLNWYEGAKAANGLYWTGVYEDPQGRGSIITCAVPFYDYSSGVRVMRGIAANMVLLSDFSQMIDSGGIGSSGQLFIVDRGGTKMYTSDGTLTGENLLESSSARVRSLGLSMTLGASGMTELEMDGLSVYTAYAPIQTLGWSLGVAVSVQEISAPALLIENQIWKITGSIKTVLNRYILLLAGLIALMLVLTAFGIVVFALRFTRAVTGPILALNDEVHEIAGGNLDREVIIKTGDELEQLAVSFNMMTAQLRKHIKEIAQASAERQRIDTELDVATRIQMSMLPTGFPPFRGRKNEFDLYAQVHPAREVGGDFYDFFFIDDDHFVVMVADVSGKGVPAALFMAITKTIIKNRLQSGEDPVLALEIINRELCDNNIMDMFVTTWLSVLEISSNRLVYVNAGHNPPLVRHGDQGFTFLVSPPDLVLAGMEDTRYHSRELQLQAGDTLFLYTDGIVEAVDPHDTLYSKERLRQFLDANAAQPLRDMLHGLRADIAAFAAEAEQSDDITMLALRINAAAIQQSSITLKADTGELGAFSAFLGAYLDAGVCPARERSQIELAAEEIFVNIARYAYPQDSGGTVTIECRLEPSPEKTAITLIFYDQGRFFNPLEHNDPDITLPLEKREPGGLGLLIVKKTMDTIHYSHEQETNRLEFSKSWQQEGK